MDIDNKLHNFPGLSIPDGDEIDLDLDVDAAGALEPIALEKKEEIAKKEEKIEDSYIIKREGRDGKKKSKSRSKSPRQRSKSYDR